MLEMDLTGAIGKRAAAMDENSRDFAYAEDLSWVIGRLQHEQFEGGFWTLEFGDASAPHGGVLVLGNPPELADARDGSIVRLEGHADPDRMGFWMAGTFYDVTHAREVPA